MSRGIMFMVVILAVICIGGAAFNVALWDNSRSLDAQIKAEKAARLSESERTLRAKRIAQVASCVQGIPLVAIANQLIDDSRADHRNRAAQADALAKVDPTPALARTHRAIARQQRVKAAGLRDFPKVTQAQCDRLADRLGVPRVKPQTSTRKKTSARPSPAPTQTVAEQK